MRKPSDFLLVIGFLVILVSAIRAQLAEVPIVNETYDFTWDNSSYTAEGVRDPFKSYIEMKKNITDGPIDENIVLPELTVQAVVWGGPFPQAIVNDIIVKINETVGDTEAKVVDITKSRVDFEYKRVVFNSTVKIGNYTTRDNTKTTNNNQYNYPNSGSSNSYLPPTK